MVLLRFSWPILGLGVRCRKSVLKDALAVAGLVLCAMCFWTSTAIANDDCSHVESELQQIHALLPALESSDGDVHGHIAVATGLLRRLRAVANASGQRGSSAQFDTSTQLIKGFLEAAKSQATGGPVGLTNERSQITRSVRKVINGMQCHDRKAGSGGESGEDAGMAARLLKAAANSDPSSGSAVPYGVGFSAETAPFSFSHWVQSLSLKVYVGIIIVICIVSLTVVAVCDWRKQKRYAIRIPTMVQFGQVSLELTMYDLSVGGARLSSLPGVKPGDRISVTLGERNITAEIRWLGDKCFGVKFDRQLDRSDLRRVLGFIF